MDLLKEIMDECEARNYNCSVTYQKINNHSVEIYTGYKKNYSKVFYTDGHIRPESAILEGLEYLDNVNL